MTSSIRCTRAPVRSHGRDARMRTRARHHRGTPDKPRDIWKCQPDKHTTNVSSSHEEGEGGKETRLSPFSVFFLPLFYVYFRYGSSGERDREREREYRICNGLLKEDDAERYGMNGRVILGWKSTKAFSLFSFPFSLDSFFRNGKIYNGAPPSNLSRLKIFSSRQKTRKFYPISFHEYD